MTTEAYLEQLEQKHAEETKAVYGLQVFWCQAFPDREWIPVEKRFLWWVRTYGVRLMKHAITITATNAAPDWSVTRLGKDCSGVARNIHEQAQKEAA
jgi:hypothetical protein